MVATERYFSALAILALFTVTACAPARQDEGPPVSAASAKELKEQDVRRALTSMTMSEEYDPMTDRNRELAARLLGAQADVQKLDSTNYEVEIQILLQDDKSVIRANGTSGGGMRLLAVHAPEALRSRVGVKATCLIANCRALGAMATVMTVVDGVEVPQKLAMIFKQDRVDGRHKLYWSASPTSDNFMGGSRRTVEQAVSEGGAPSKPGENPETIPGVDSDSRMGNRLHD